MFGQVNGIGSVDSINFGDDQRKKMQEQQPQVAFINTIFEGYGNSSGTEASFNA